MRILFLIISVFCFLFVAGCGLQHPVSSDDPSQTSLDGEEGSTPTVNIRMNPGIPVPLSGLVNPLRDLEAEAEVVQEEESVADQSHPAVPGWKFDPPLSQEEEVFPDPTEESPPEPEEEKPPPPDLVTEEDTADTDPVHNEEDENDVDEREDPPAEDEKPESDDEDDGFLADDVIE